MLHRGHFLLVFFLTNFFFLLYANKNFARKNAGIVSSRQKKLSQVSCSQADIGSSWAEISNPLISLQELEKSCILSIKDWNSQNLSDFQSLPDFKQVNSLEEVKKIILKALLKQKNVIPISQFLIRANISDEWCLLLEYITSPLWDSQKSPYGITIKDISALLSVPLSKVKCQGLKLPIPENFLDAFEQADEVLSEKKQEDKSCLVSNDEKNKNSSENPSSKKSYVPPQSGDQQPRDPQSGDQQPRDPQSGDQQPRDPYAQDRKEGGYYDTSYQKPVSTYVKAEECLEFWVSSIIEQSMRYIKKKPHVWNALFKSANADPMNQRIVQHIRSSMGENSSQSYDHESGRGYNEGAGSYGGNGVISASGSGAQGSSKPFTDPQYLDSREESAPQESQEPAAKRKTVTFFSKQKKAVK
ncbi:proline-rich domain-containing protein [Holospora undulata]|uniref:Uncharacterized protein n=1 Tax=Holospora undulata HU1 TaxID=1321371 RepID=A0A061JFY2_9PROT|nr:proline-rich domain-containing protein [Holospora undulata]ETZ04696.1 hypothetical protein K737_300916 [Holospora undulata HU1]